MKLRFYSMLLAIALSLTAAAQSRYAQSVEKIDPDRLEHPYLVFDSTGRDEMRARIASDPAAAARFDELLKQGEKILARAPEEELQLPLRDLQARAKGISDPFDTYVASRSSEASFLGYLYQITGDERFARKGYQYAADVCATDSWMTGAHGFENIYNRVWPYGADDDQVVFLYDMYAADIACFMSYAYDWLYPALSKAERDRLRGGLLEKVVLRAAGAYDYHWWTNAARCNWCGINHASVGLAALAVLPENQELKWVVDRSCQGVGDMFSNVDEQGGWQEGRHYLHFALENMLGFMDAIKNVTGGDIDFYNVEPIKSHSTDFMLFGLTGNFCDSNDVGTEMRKYVASHLASATQDPVAKWFMDNYYPDNKFFDGGIWDFIYPYPEGLRAVKPADASKLFPGIHWAFMRKDFGEEYVQVATKAGNADDPHHGHLDNGTVNISWMGETVIGEFKRTFYDLKVFDEDRFGYLHVQSRGHNVVLVDDSEQQMSKHKNQPWGHIYGGKVEYFTSQGPYAATLMDLTGAYDGESLKLWKRAIVLDKERNGVIIIDQVGSAKGAKVDVMFHPMVKASVEPDGKHVALRGEKARMNMLALASQPFEIIAGNQQYIMQMVGFEPVDIPFYSVRANARRETTCIATVFYPEGVKVKGRVGADAAAPSLSLDVDGCRIEINNVFSVKNLEIKFAR